MNRRKERDASDMQIGLKIQKLRKKLGFEDRIQTVYKLGYRLSTKE